MAKMKIYEIARSLQEKFPEVKSRDLVELLQANGFEAKGAQSSIEDAAIGFVLKHFQALEKARAEGKEAGTAPAKEKQVASTEKKAVKKEKTEEKSQSKEASTAKQEKDPKKVDTTVEKKAAPEKAEEKEVVSSENKTVAERNAVNKKTQENRSVEKKREENHQNDKDYRRRGSSHDENRENRDGGSRGGKNDNRGGRTDRNAGRDGDNRGSRGGRGGYGDNRGGRGSYGDNRGREDNRGNRGGYGDNRGGKTDNRGGRADNRGGRTDNRGSRGGNSYGNRSQSGPMESMQSSVKQSRQQRSGKDSRSAKQKYGKDRNRSYDEDEMFLQKNKKKKDPNRKGAFIKPEPVVKPAEPEDGIRTIVIPEKLTVKELADTMKVPPATVIKGQFMKGTVVTMNHELTFEEAEEIALEYNCIAEMEEKVDLVAELLKEEEEDEALMEKRPPVVCVMGHVDHGKTSLLDAIRETHVTSREAGGITQHIGAYVTEINGEKITFLDTPGHEAFTSMRMRGAQSTDIAVLVVAADDGVMPQTIEAINHAKAAGVEIIVAVNKIDKPSANIERVKQELVEHELVAEDWGGSTIFVPVSAHTKEGIDQLLEMIVLTADVAELKANPNRKARGVVIEAQLDKGRGPVATVLVQKGTLHVGDNLAIGAAYGKIRAMMDDKGRRVEEALPSTPVEILGLHAVPDAGEIFIATDNDKEARNIADTYINQSREKMLDETKSRLTLDGLFSQIQAGNIKELNIIIKADVQGSVEAVKQSLLKLSNEEVAVRVIHGGVGAINESDVSLASASNAIIIGFNVRPDNTAKESADREQVDIRLYKVIYNAIEDVEAAMKGMLDPEYEERVTGHLEVRQTFKASGVGIIAGSYVLDGKVVRGSKVRISREGEQIFEGELASLKRFKDDVKEVAAGYECGLVFEGFNEVQVEDQIEAYIMVEVPR